MKVVRTSTRLVKPEGEPLLSGHGSCIPLSSFDLSIAPVYAEFLCAFHDPAPPTPLLESSLAKVLTQYREWAGRLGTDDTGRPAIHLTDDGAALIEAEADGSLDDLVPFNPSFQLLELIPINTGVPELLLIQLTRFTCGGMTIGVASHHQVADGEAVSGFMDAWALTVRGLPIPFSPLHDRSALMVAREYHPPRSELADVDYQRPAPKPDEVAKVYDPELATKKLHFSVELLKKIKAQAAKGAGEGVTYTTFESLLAHLWKCITKARGLENEEGETRALVPVNARKRLNPLLPKEYFGNAICHACPQATIKELLAQPLSFAANLVHAAIKNVTSDYVRSAFDLVELQQKYPVQIARTLGTAMTPNLIVTSWVNLPLYKLDFGFGTPIFVGNPFIPYEGLVILVPTKDGSIDVVLGLFEPDMAKLEPICYHLDQ